jgi:AcrR family transcriptional regulator
MQDGTKISAARGRGRPRRVEPDEALTRALDAFWTGGYTGTSLDELSAATGLNRPSLYATFGDKRQLYLRALARFADGMEAAVGAAMADAQTLRDALARFYGGALAVYLGDSGGGSAGLARGCFVIGTAAVDAPEEPAIREALQAVLMLIDTRLTTRFRQAIAAGELPPDTDAEALGMLAAATLHSLAIRARAGTPRPVLERLAAAAVVQLLGPAG